MTARFVQVRRRVVDRLVVLAQFWQKHKLSRDALVFVGLGVLGHGLHQIQPALAFIVLGAFLVYLGAFHGATWPRRPDREA